MLHSEHTFEVIKHKGKNAKYKSLKQDARTQILQHPLHQATVHQPHGPHRLRKRTLDQAGSAVCATEAKQLAALWSARHQIWTGAALNRGWAQRRVAHQSSGTSPTHCTGMWAHGT